jgi:hypothetical protein
MDKTLEKILERNKKIGIPYFCNDIERIIEDISIETGLTKTEIKGVVDAQFKTLKEVMQEDGIIDTNSKFNALKSIRLTRLGSFRPSPLKFEHIQKNLILKSKINDKED